MVHGIGTTRDDYADLAPRLAAGFEVLVVDLPGHGRSGAVPGRPSVSALAHILGTDLDRLGMSRVHMLGNSLGARLALELARRHRALSVVAIAPSGMGLPPERVYQALLMGTARLALRAARPLIEPLSRSRPGRALLLAGLRARPGQASEAEARAVKAGFAESDDFWRTLGWTVLADLPTGLKRIDCPVILAQGTRDWLSGGQTPRYLLAAPGSRFQPLRRAGHAAHSDSADDIIRLVHEAADRSRTRPTPERKA
jgi:pimeloyl-ACP methyl ester carboxylesterase